jgi:hypothetical protein
VEFHRQLKSQIPNPKSPNSKSAIRNPQSAIGVAGALRQAALNLMKKSDYRHPFHWAGFVVVGDGR